MVGVAQLVEPRIVIPVVAGSSPVVHPIFQDGPLAQLVEQETLNLLVVGSTPTRPTKFLVEPRARHRRQDERRPSAPFAFLRFVCALDRSRARCRELTTPDRFDSIPIVRRAPGVDRVSQRRRSAVDSAANRVKSAPCAGSVAGGPAPNDCFGDKVGATRDVPGRATESRAVPPRFTAIETARIRVRISAGLNGRKWRNW